MIRKEEFYVKVVDNEPQGDFSNPIEEHRPHGNPRSDEYPLYIQNKREPSNLYDESFEYWFDPVEKIVIKNFTYTYAKDYKYWALRYVDEKVMEEGNKYLDEIDITPVELREGLADDSFYEKIESFIMRQRPVRKALKKAIEDSSSNDEIENILEKLDEEIG